VWDVRTAWLSSNTAFRRAGVAAELAKEADLGLSLAHSRYQLGLGSIVELSQAQLQQTDAAICCVNAQPAANFPLTPPVELDDTTPFH